MKLFLGSGELYEKEALFGAHLYARWKRGKREREDWKEEGWVICGSAGTDLRVITDSDSAHSSISLDLRSVPD